MKLIAHAGFITLEAENDIENDVISQWKTMTPWNRGGGVRCIVDLPWDRSRTGNIHSLSIGFMDKPAKPEPPTLEMGVQVLTFPPDFQPPPVVVNGEVLAEWEKPPA